MNIILNYYLWREEEAGGFKSQDVGLCKHTKQRGNISKQYHILLDDGKYDDDFTMGVTPSNWERYAVQGIGIAKQLVYTLSPWVHKKK